MAIRSGRFKITDPAGGTATIIKGRSGAFYRIFNSGDNEFTVKPNRTGIPGDEIPLKPTFSVDVVAGNDVVVEAEAATEGIYEYLDTQNPIRSGRFKMRLVEVGGKEDPVVDPPYPHMIIDLRKGSDRAWYRIFNSGENTIVLQYDKDNPQELIELAKEQSFDFEVGSSYKEILVSAKDGTQLIEGIYEFLGRSG